MSKVAPSPASRFSPAERLVEQRFLDVIRRTFELHGFSSIETRSIEPINRPDLAGRDADKEIYAISRLAGGGRDEPVGLHFDPPSRSRYVLENAGTPRFPVPALSDPEAWRGERPQEGVIASSPRPISTSSTSDLWRPLQAEMPLVIADVFARSRWATSSSGQQSAPGQRLLCRTRHPGIAGTLRIVDKLDKIRAGRGRRPAARGRRGPGQARACLDLAAITSFDLRFIDEVAPSAWRIPRTDAGIEALAAVIETASAHAPGRVAAALKVAAGSTTTPAPSMRPSSSATGTGARSVPADATTPSPPTAARPIRASASRSVSPHFSASLLGRVSFGHRGRPRPPYSSR